jgi:hypothetical protein
MNPRARPVPERVGVDRAVLEELARYGGRQEYKPAMTAAAIFWQDTARVDGLPESWKDAGLVVKEGGVPERQGRWRLYVKVVSGVRMGFAESEEGDALLLMLMRPAGVIGQRAAIEEVRRRL